MTTHRCAALSCAVVQDSDDATYKNMQFAAQLLGNTTLQLRRLNAQNQVQETISCTLQ